MKKFSQPADENGHALLHGTQEVFSAKWMGTAVLAWWIGTYWTLYPTNIIKTEFHLLKN